MGDNFLSDFVLTEVRKSSSWKPWRRLHSVGPDSLCPPIWKIAWVRSESPWFSESFGVPLPRQSRWGRSLTTGDPGNCAGTRSRGGWWRQSCKNGFLEIMPNFKTSFQANWCLFLCTFAAWITAQKALQRSETEGRELMERREQNPLKYEVTDPS